MDTQQQTPVRSGGGFGAARVTALVIGSILALVGLGLLGAGGVAAWTAGQRDADGYVRSAQAVASTRTAALVSEQVQLRGTPDAVIDWAGTAQVSVTSIDDTALFVGVAPAADLARYLAGTAYDRVSVDDPGLYVTDVRIRYHRVAGDINALPRPADQQFWAASTTGTGRQVLSWHPDDGNWVLLIANADGTPNVRAVAQVGIRTPVLDWAGPALLVAGGVAIVVGALLITLGVRGRRGEPIDHPTGPVENATPTR